MKTTATLILLFTAAIAIPAFDMLPGSSPVVALLPGVKGQQAFMSFQVDQPAGTGAVFIDGDVAALDWGLDMQQAVSFPNFVNRNGATDLEAGTALAAVAEGLEALGHEVKQREMTSGLHAIRVRPDGTLEGGADPRREGVVYAD